MRKLIIILLFPLSVYGQPPDKVQGWFKTMRPAFPIDSIIPPSPPPKIFYRIVLGYNNFADTAIDGVSAIVQGTRYSLYGGWNASNGVPYTRNSVYSSSTTDFEVVSKAYAQWTPRHSIGYGVGGTGIGYVVGGDAQPEATATSRTEVWQTVTTTSADDWVLITNSPGWNDSLILCGFAIQPDTVNGIDTLWYGGGQKGYALSDGINGKMYRSIDGGAVWTLEADNEAHLGGIMSGNMCWFANIRKFVVLKAGKYDNEAGNKVYSDSLFTTTDFNTYEFIAKSPNPVQYPAMAVWDNKVWLVDGFSSAQGNTNRIFTVNENLIFSEMVITTPTPLHATSLAVDKINDRLIIGCGNLVRDVWYIEKVSEL